MNLSWPLADTAAGSDVFLQYGVVGVVALALAAVARYLYKQQISTLKDRLERAEARADRLEAALANVNEGALAQARAAVETANATVTRAIRRIEGTR